MTKKELEERNAELERTKQDKDALIAYLQQQAEERNKPSLLWQWWNRYKSVIIALVLGMMLGGAVTGIVLSAISKNQTALGGAAVPFPELTLPNESRLPSPLITPPDNSTKESTGTSSTSISEPPSESSQQADNGQAPSIPSSRTLIRRIR